MTRHPGTDSQLGVTVSSRRVNVIDAVFEQHVQGSIRIVLIHPTERSGPKQRHRAHMSRSAKGSFFDHTEFLVMLGCLGRVSHRDREY